MDTLFLGSFFRKNFAAAAALALLIAAPCAKADTVIGTTSSSRVLQEALASHNGVSIYNGKHDGLSLAGGLFSGRASGIDPSIPNYLKDGSNGFSSDRTAEMEGDQRVYALLLDGKYKINSDLGSGLPLKPYMSGGLGMAMYGHPNTPSVSNLGMQGGDMVPLARIGAGVSYQLGEKWDMSLDYKAGFSMGADQISTSHTPQQADLHTINMGMHYQF